MTNPTCLSGEDDEGFVALEAVHLAQDLVEGLRTLVVAASQAGAASAADRLELVNER
jgi:hypothetical protein